MSENKKALTAKNLKSELWEVLQELRAGKIEPSQADAVAMQSREIIRVLRVQQSIIKQASEKITSEMLQFVNDAEG